MAIVSTPADLDWKAAGTASSVVAMPGRTVCGLYIPASFAGTSVKIQAFRTEADAVGFTVADGAGADVSYAVAAGKYVRVNPADFAGVERFRLVSSAAEAANTVVGVAAREID